MPKRLLIIVGIIIFCFSLLAHLPARLVIPSRAGKLQFEGISGTLWRGQTRRISYEDKPLPIADLNWSVGFWSLLTGGLKADFSEAGVSNNRGEVHLDLLSGQIKLYRLQWQFPAAEVVALMPLSDVAAEGTVFLDIESLVTTTSGSFPVDLAGRLGWRQAAIQAGSEYWPIGSPRLTLTERDNAIEGVIENSQPTLPGNGKLFCTRENCQIELNIEPTLEAPQSLLNLIAMTGLKQNGTRWQGRINFRL